jgi:hypothetical protein
VAAEFFIGKWQLSTDIPKGTSQLIVVAVISWQPIIIH